MSEPSRVRPNYYAGSDLDRVAHRRLDADWLAARLTDPRTVIVPVWRSENLVRPANLPSDAASAGLPNADFPHPDLTNDVPSAGLPRLGAVTEAMASAGEVALLGTIDAIAYFAIDLSPLDDPLTLPGLADHGQFIGLRTVGSAMRHQDASLLAYARGLMHWHARHRFCGVCGSPTRSAEAGHLRLCTDESCKAQHHPRTDPAVIMLVTDGERCLVGRQSAWPPGMYSTLAGFLEPGESLEETVMREVFEEAGIRVADVRYHSSQPWPFPQSLMIGFTARAVTADIRRGTLELEDARWVTRDFLRRPKFDDSFKLPPDLSIARRLIDDWTYPEGMARPTPEGLAE